eukprot:Tbor_TRINITY_DN6187_c0_g2::TRINITY_DN6187_c0_g2_i1::g.22751::m.22751/K06641/CHK2; serine/threonine-protein kinase Chk2
MNATIPSLEFTLVPLGDGPTITRTVHRGDSVTIGRDASKCDILCECPAISRTHCTLVIMQEEVSLVDMSSNGTYINGRKVQKTNHKILIKGDIISLINPSLPDSAACTWKYIPVVPSAAPITAVVGGVIGHYRIQKMLGTGSSAKVYLGVHEVTGDKVALKVVTKSQFELGSQFNLQTLNQEVKILKEMKHDNIIGLLEYFEIPLCFVMVLELVSHGNLFDYVICRTTKGNAPFSEAEGKILFTQILQAVLYIHSKSIVHCDLKPENILVSVDSSFLLGHEASDNKQHVSSIPPSVVTLKITDFGLGKYYEDNDENIVTSNVPSMCGTPCYLAPEAVQGARDIPAAQRYTAIDVWSLGIILFVLLSGKMPNNPQSGEVAFPEVMMSISNKAKDLIKGMLRAVSTHRFNLREICDHPWLKGVDIKGRELVGHISTLSESFNDQGIVNLTMKRSRDGVDVTGAHHTDDVENKKRKHENELE